MYSVTLKEKVNLLVKGTNLFLKISTQSWKLSYFYINGLKAILFDVTFRYAQGKK